MQTEYTLSFVINLTCSLLFLSQAKILLTDHLSNLRLERKMEGDCCSCLILAAYIINLHICFCHNIMKVSIVTGMKMERSAFCKNLKSAFPSFYNNYTVFITPSDYSILKFQIMDGGGPDTALDLVLKVNSHKITNMYFFPHFY